MDNITHSLVGAAIAQASLQWQQESSPSTQEEAATPRQAAAWPIFLASIFGNNFPDLDLLMMPFVSQEFGYILHHRGHTHTLVFLPLQWVLMMLGFWLFARWRKCDWSASDWKWISGLSFLGGVVHISMDSWNVYGIHPLWPFDNRWFYGDFVFILEPLFWLVLVPWLVASARLAWTRWLMCTIYGVGALALCLVYYKTWWYPLFVLFFAFGYAYFMTQKLSLPWRPVASFLALGLVLATLLSTSRLGEASLKQAIHAKDPGEKVLDVAIMSYPSHPFCMSFVTLASVPSRGTLRVRQGLYTLAPGLFWCPDLRQGRDAPVVTAGAQLRTQRGGIQGQMVMFERPLHELHQMTKQDCRVRAALRFIRVPYWQLLRTTPQGHQTTQGATRKGKVGQALGSDWTARLGDMRFDRTKGKDLAEFVFTKPAKRCPVWVPSWVPPLVARGLSLPLSKGKEDPRP